MGSTLTVDNIKDSGDNTLVSSTGSGYKMNLSGTTPASPVAGDMYFDTTLNALKIYNGTEWYLIFTAIGSGGTETTYTGYKVHTFTTSGIFIVNGSASLTCDVLVVAGGGGGGCGKNGSGAGAGGMVVSPAVSIPVGTYSVTVGAGGNGGPANTTSGTGAQGGHSSFYTPTIPEAIGGGGGINYANLSTDNAGSGGSGGGCGDDGSGSGGSGTTGQGYPGESSIGGVNATGGGGGAGEAGGTNGDRYGGDGLQNAYQTGSNIYYAGGGSGAEDSNRATIAGGEGGGGTGHGTNQPGGHGTNGLGGGGGGAGENTAQPGGNGGSGIVVIRYAI